LAQQADTQNDVNVILHSGFFFWTNQAGYDSLCFGYPFYCVFVGVRCLPKTSGKAIAQQYEAAPPPPKPADASVATNIQSYRENTWFLKLKSEPRDCVDLSGG
jgi:hypothetical protein